MFVCVLLCFVHACGVCQILCDDVLRVLGLCVLLYLCVLRYVCGLFMTCCAMCVWCVARVCVCACGG